MRLTLSRLANFLGSRVLPFTNPRVVSPPGVPRRTGGCNIVVATPMRSGTHVLIDMLLNNVPALRAKPLYIDLDQCWKQSGESRDLIGQISREAGQIIKTHMPIHPGPEMAADPRIAALLEAAIVVTIRRDRAAVSRSLSTWHQQDTLEAQAAYDTDYDRFWEFWEPRPQIALAFEELFDASKMARRLDEICQAAGIARQARFVGPPLARRKLWIYTHKALTRLLGRHAPRIDTTIHTLKS